MTKYELDLRRKWDLEQSNRDHNVIERPDDFAGWHVSCVHQWKPGVYSYMATQTIGVTVHCKNGYVRQDVLRVAIETGVIKKPNGYTMP